MNNTVDKLARAYVVARAPTEASYFVATIEKFLEEAHDAVTEFEYRNSGPSLADEDSNVSKAVNILRNTSKELSKASRLLR